MASTAAIAMIIILSQPANSPSCKCRMASASATTLRCNPAMVDSWRHTVSCRARISGAWDVAARPGAKAGLHGDGGMHASSLHMLLSPGCGVCAVRTHAARFRAAGWTKHHDWLPGHLPDHDRGDKIWLPLLSWFSWCGLLGAPSANCVHGAAQRTCECTWLSFNAAARYVAKAASNTSFIALKYSGSLTTDKERTGSCSALTGRFLSPHGQPMI